MITLEEKLQKIKLQNQLKEKYLKEGIDSENAEAIAEIEAGNATIIEKKDNENLFDAMVRSVGMDEKELKEFYAEGSNR